MSSKCADPRPKKTDARTQFAFLGRSAAGRRITAEDELEQLSGSGYSAGVEEDIALNVSAAILYVTRCLTGSQWSDLRSGLASVRPPRWQTTLARLFCARCSASEVAAGAPQSMALQ